MKVAVVIPTIGAQHLEQCLDSVLNQTYKDTTIYLFKDGLNVKIPSFVNNISNIKQIHLDENVGKGWYGHRVYAACSFLVNADIICYLDEDNFYEPEHVQTLVETISKGNDWAYSLRNIVDKNGEFICTDDCESLGKWPVYFNNEIFHIDTSCFAVRRDVAVRVGHSWYGQWGADRQFFGTIKKHYPKFDCTNTYTVNYRLDGNPNSVTKDFFEQGNKETHAKYGDKYPWLDKKELVQVAPGVSIIMKEA
jgi:glycosyltransferase involved in cell wall biosynthesis